jgi:thiamine kinase-like enzyme
LKSIEQILPLIDDWKNKKPTFELLGGGITNHNYAVTVDGEKFVVRIPGVGSDLFVNRSNELECSVQAARTGISPEVVYHIRDEDVSVIRFINGRTLRTAEIAGNDHLIRRIVQAVKIIHRDARFSSLFSPFQTVSVYLGHSKRYEVPLPSDLDWMVETVNRIERVMARNRPPYTACHNDYLSENFSDDGERIWIIDWEYGGNGDPFFDLGDFAVEHPFSREQEELIIREYCGRIETSRLYRMLLHKVVSDLWWGLWAMIQTGISQIDFDFLTYGQNRFERLRRNARHLEFETWIDGV